MARRRVRTLGSPTQFAKETWTRERPDLDPSAYLYLVFVTRLGHLVDRLHDRYSRQAFGLSGDDIRTLIILKRTQSTVAPKPAELAESQMVTTGAITKQLDRLERAGLAKRGPYRGEGGGIAVFATPKGLKLADAAMSSLVGASPLGQMQHCLSRRERELLAKLCEKLLLSFERA